MKIHRAAIKLSPLQITFTFELNGQIKQILIKSERLSSFAKDKNISIDELMTIINSPTDNNRITYIEELITASNFRSKSDIQADISQISDYNIDDVAPELKSYLSQLLNSGVDYFETLNAWLNFSKKLQENVDPYIRAQLFNFLNYLIIEEGSLKITKDGNIIGYKGVSTTHHSIHEGEAFVDGKLIKGYIPNKLNSIISMNRLDVEADPNSACSYGLHVGSFKYAKKWGSKLILVELDPKDVVSIPNDCNSQKLRCCKYKVVKYIENIDDFDKSSTVVDINSFNIENDKAEDNDEKLSDLSLDDLGAKTEDNDEKLSDLSLDDLGAKTGDNSEKLSDLSLDDLGAKTEDNSEKLSDLSIDDLGSKSETLSELELTSKNLSDELERLHQTYKELKTSLNNSDLLDNAKVSGKSPLSHLIDKKGHIK